MKLITTMRHSFHSPLLCQTDVLCTPAEVVSYTILYTLLAAIVTVEASRTDLAGGLRRRPAAGPL